LRKPEDLKHAKTKRGKSLRDCEINKPDGIGMYLLDVGDIIYIYICRGIHALILERLLGITRLQDVDETLTELPE
jgi:hypothetical protein